MTEPVTHVGFADESYRDGRFRSVSLVTLSADRLDEFEAQLRQILMDHNVTELKWSTLRKGRCADVAPLFLQWLVERAFAGQVRADTIIWDTHDSRHAVYRRDDNENLKRMYFHLMKYVATHQWPDDAIWRFHPDELNEISWESLKEYLEGSSVRSEWDRTFFANKKYVIWLRRVFTASEIESVRSVERPFVQLADLLGGLAVFSRLEFEGFAQWKEDAGSQLRLDIFGPPSTKATPSKNSLQRYVLLSDFDNICKARTLGVSLKREQRLKTYHPKNPINFWWYTPQHSADKAPTVESH